MTLMYYGKVDSIKYLSKYIIDSTYQLCNINNEKKLLFCF